MTISSNSFYLIFWIVSVRMPGCHGSWHFECLKAEKIIVNSGCTIILPLMRVKNITENVDFILQKQADESYLVKIILIMHNKGSHSDIAHNCVT